MAFFFYNVLVIVFFILLSNISGESKRLPGKVDVCVATAFGSRYYGKSTARALEIASILAERMSISSSTTRIALITLGQINHHHGFGFNKCVNRECVLMTLKTISKTRQRTLTSKSNLITNALQSASKLFRQQKRYDAKKYILLITDPSAIRAGHFSYVLQRLKKQNVAIYIIVVSSMAALDSKVYKRLDVLTSGKSKQQVIMLLLQGSNAQIAVKKLPFAKVSYSDCTGSNYVFDECERRCTCVKGKLTKCQRVRKEFTEMSIKERIRFINTYKKLATSPKYKAKYAKFLTIHKDLFYKGIHTSDYFLPWHRWYILAFENMLRLVDCRVTIPYWDWAFWSNSAWQENIHIWNGKAYGLGGDGDPKRGYCVQDGPFKEGTFNTPEFDDPNDVVESANAVKNSRVVANLYGTQRRCLRRSFSGKPLGIPAIKSVLANKVASFSTFETAIRMNLHNSMHSNIGGHMSSIYASLAPEFFLHHTFLDKLWHTWQMHSLACKRVRFSHQLHKMKKFKCSNSPKDLMDSNNLPGHINVAYTDYYYDARKASMKRFEYSSPSNKRPYAIGKMYASDEGNNHGDEDEDVYESEAGNYEYEVAADGGKHSFADEGNDEDDLGQDSDFNNNEEMSSDNFEEDSRLWWPPFPNKDIEMN